MQAIFVSYFICMNNRKLIAEKTADKDFQALCMTKKWYFVLINIKKKRICPIILEAPWVCVH